MSSGQEKAKAKAIRQLKKEAKAKIKAEARAKAEAKAKAEAEVELKIKKKALSNLSKEMKSKAKAIKKAQAKDIKGSKKKSGNYSELSDLSAVAVVGIVIAGSLALVVFLSFLSGFISSENNESAYVDDIRVYVDNYWDESICNTAVVVKSESYYTCSFTLDDPAKIAIELGVSNTGSKVDLITVDDLNFEAWENGDEYYYKVDLSDFETYGGSYNPDGSLDKGEYFVIISNLDR